uniref:Uncharacterized protein n=1 Tax=Arundo donax TaxID=35708 RepID=A0A0A9D8M5_ARUDO
MLQSMAVNVSSIRLLPFITMSRILRLSYLTQQSREHLMFFIHVRKLLLKEWL